MSMKINVDELADYYARTGISLYNTYADRVPSGRKVAGWATDKQSGGLIFPLEGSACFTLDGTPYVMEPGMVIHAGPGMRLDKEVIGDGVWRYALVHYQIPDEQILSFPYYNAHFQIPVGKNPRLMDMLARLQAIDAASGGVAALSSRSLFHGLIEEMVMSAMRVHCHESEGLIEDAVAYIDGHYSQQFTIAQLAGQYGMEGKRFSELFQRYVGMSPIRYLTQLRINRSKELLRSCEFSVMQVAECVGYADPLYFSKLFKKRTGFSPTMFQAEGKVHAAMGK